MSVNQNPNVEYIFRNVSGIRPLQNELLIESKKHQIIHRYRWVEFVVQLEKPSQFNRNRVFDKNLERSSYREEKLIEWIDYFKNYGKVYLLRVPFFEDIKLFEDTFTPYFQEYVKNLAKKDKVFNLEYSNESDRFELVGEKNTSDRTSVPERRRGVETEPKVEQRSIIGIPLRVVTFHSSLFARSFGLPHIRSSLLHITDAGWCSMRYFLENQHIFNFEYDLDARPCVSTIF